MCVAGKQNGSFAKLNRKTFLNLIKTLIFGKEKISIQEEISAWTN